jgi:hypothetical protein
LQFSNPASLSEQWLQLLKVKEPSSGKLKDEQAQSTPLHFSTNLSLGMHVLSCRFNVTKGYGFITPDDGKLFTYPHSFITVVLHNPNSPKFLPSLSTHHPLPFPPPVSTIPQVEQTSLSTSLPLSLRVSAVFARVRPSNSLLRTLTMAAPRPLASLAQVATHQKVPHADSHTEAAEAALAMEVEATEVAVAVAVVVEAMAMVAMATAATTTVVAMAVAEEAEDMAVATKHLPCR